MFSKKALTHLYSAYDLHLDIRLENTDWFVIFNFENNKEFSFEIDSSYVEYNNDVPHRIINRKTAYKLWILMGKPEWI